MREPGERGGVREDESEVRKSEAAVAFASLFYK